MCQAESLTYVALLQDYIAFFRSVPSIFGWRPTLIAADANSTVRCRGHKI